MEKTVVILSGDVVPEGRGSGRRAHRRRRARQLCHRAARRQQSAGSPVEYAGVTLDARRAVSVMSAHNVHAAHSGETLELRVLVH